MTDRSVQRYLAKVKRALPRDEQRTRYIARAAAMMEDFLVENPNAQEDDLLAAFGPPADFAAEMVGEQGVAQAKKQRRRLCFASISVVLAALVVVATVFFCKWRELRAIIPEGEYVVIEPARTLTPEEFEAIWNDPNSTTNTFD